MAPSKDQIRAAIETLRSDARMWSSMADELHEAGHQVFRLGLGRSQFSYLGDEAGLTQTYSNIQSTLGRLLAEGRAAFDDIAAALESAADGYEQDERNNLHRLHGIY
jgi:hypothetical protein